LDSALIKEQKEKFKCYFTEKDIFRIDACSCNRRDLEISFFLKISNAKYSASYLFYIEIKFTSFFGEDFSYTSSFVGDVPEQEISELILWPSLKS
jgi:hypothetical protein